MPRVHARPSGFPKTYGLKRNRFLIGHTWLTYFSEHTGQAEYVRVQSKSPIKLNRSKKPSTRTIPRKEWCGKTSTNIFDRGNSGKKEKIIKRLTGESWKQFEFEPCYTCDNTSQFSYKSRVLHSIMVVRTCGGIFERGAPASLTTLLISVHMSTKKCNWRWILHNFVLLSGFYFKKLLLVLHLFGT